ncbi:polynucleotide 5 -hydroxyl-kinase [Cystoisospora suis]|uniref:Polynucleotide 5-hydroxyl-kinase n=1 Tax=Cystoisospora suis TaxID=483139 RepID=A0A2C6LB87_9APIC|nr:polynucleotide 5 -hydroxyl-kinase [Cystoisospora suis]
MAAHPFLPPGVPPQGAPSVPPFYMNPREDGGNPSGEPLIPSHSVPGSSEVFSRRSLSHQNGSLPRPSGEHQRGGRHPMSTERKERGGDRHHPTHQPPSRSYPSRTGSSSSSTLLNGSRGEGEGDSGDVSSRGEGRSSSRETRFHAASAGGGGGKVHHHPLRSGHQGSQQQNAGERRNRGGGWGKGSSSSLSSSSGFISGAGAGRDVTGAATAHGILQGGRAGGGSSGRGSCAAVRVHTLKPMTELRLVLEENQRDLTVAPPGADARPTDASTLIRLLPSDSPHPREVNSGRGAGGGEDDSSSSSSGHSYPMKNPDSSEDGRINSGALPGTAEIFGSELLPDVEYPLLPGSRLAVFSWGGCTLQLRGRVQQEYTASNPAMKEYLALSAVLDARRQIAALRRSLGPRVLVVGSSCSGKSSICMTLGNYAIRSGWVPTYIELDPRGSTDKPQVHIPPGCIGAVVLESLDFTAEPSFPLVFFYGRTDSPSSTSSATVPTTAIGGGVDASSSSSSSLSSFESNDFARLFSSGELHLNSNDLFLSGPGGGFDHPSGREGGGGGGVGVGAAGVYSTALFEWLCECLSCSVYLAFAENLQERESLVKEEGEKEGDLQRLLAASGLIINAPPQAGLSLIVRLVEIFNVDIVLVVDNPSLLRSIQDFFSYDEPCNESEALERRKRRILELRRSMRLHRLRRDKHRRNLGKKKGKLRGQQEGEDRSDTERIEDHERKTSLEFLGGQDEEEEEDNMKGEEEEETEDEDGDTREEEFQELFDPGGVEVVGLKKMEGAVTVDNVRLRQLRRARVLSYFLGIEGAEKRYRPQTLRLRLSEYKLVRYETTNQAPLSALPADYVRVHRQSPIVVSPWTGNPLSLLNAILAVPSTNDVDCVKFCNVACILHVYKVEEVPSLSQLEDEIAAGPTYVAEVHSPGLPGGKLPSNILLVPDDLKAMKFFVDLA